MQAPRDEAGCVRGGLARDPRTRSRASTLAISRARSWAQIVGPPGLFDRVPYRSRPEARRRLGPPPPGRVPPAHLDRRADTRDVRSRLRLVLVLNPEAGRSFAGHDQHAHVESRGGCWIPGRAYLHSRIAGWLRERCHVCEVPTRARCGFEQEPISEIRSALQGYEHRAVCEVANGAAR